MAFPNNLKDVTTNLDETEFNELVSVLDTEEQKGIKWLDHSLFIGEGVYTFQYKYNLYELYESYETVNVLIKLNGEK